MKERKLRGPRAKKRPTPSPPLRPPDIEPPQALRVAELAHGLEKYVVLSFAPPSLATNELSKAEREILTMVLEGRTNAEICERRGTTERTVANQIGKLFKKLGVTSRFELTFGRTKTDR